MLPNFSKNNIQAHACLPIFSFYFRHIRCKKGLVHWSVTRLVGCVWSRPIEIILPSLSNLRQFVWSSCWLPELQHEWGGPWFEPDIFKKRINIIKILLQIKSFFIIFYHSSKLSSSSSSSSSSRERSFCFDSSFSCCIASCHALTCWVFFITSFVDIFLDITNFVDICLDITSFVDLCYRACEWIYISIDMGVCTWGQDLMKVHHTRARNNTPHLLITCAYYMANIIFYSTQGKAQPLVWVWSTRY